ncbi:MAG: M14 family metallopeptidase [Vicinamibacterales bacterium]
MRATRIVGVTLLLAAIASGADGQPRELDALRPQELARVWDVEHVSPPLPPLLDHRELVRRLEEFVQSSSGLLRMEKAGESIEGRTIYHVTVGKGPYHVLLWSQMHGDEPTATAALFDVFDYLRRRQREPAVQRLLGTLTLHVIPMLNPDGAERFQRRNAQGIDINRDALRLQTPEGKILKDIRDRWRPGVGFNLHNQNWRTSVGDPPKPASISLLSVAFDAARSDSEGRQLTKKLCAVIRDALEPFAPGQIGRYDDEFEVRAFGDNVTLWGTPVVLIETGAWPSAQPEAALVRLNFIAILSALDSLASKSVERADPQRYESLPMNQSRAFYILVRNATVINGAGVPPFIADVGVIANRRVRLAPGSRDLQVSLVIDDIGDLRTSGGLTTIDGTGMTIVPIEEDLEVGRVVDLPEWKSKRSASIAVGESARFVLLKPAQEPGKYVVEQVIR